MQRKLRKMVELIFFGGKCIVGIYSTTRHSSKTVELERSTLGMIINEEGGRYKNILGKVKQAVKKSSTVNVIKSFKTKDGKLKEIKKALENRPSSLKSRQVEKRKQQKLLHIKEIELNVEKEELIQAIKSIIGEWAKINVKSVN